MKQRITLVACLIMLSSQAWAQMPKDPESGLFTYKGVIDVPGGKKDQILFRAKQWIVGRGDEFQNAIAQFSSVSSLQIEDDSRIQGKFSYLDVDAVDLVVGGGKSGTEVWGHFTAEVKDGKMRYTFTDFHAVYENSKNNTRSNVPLENSTFKGAIKRGAVFLPQLVEALKIHMNRKYDDW